MPLNEQDLPLDWQQARPALARLVRVNSILLRNTSGTRRRPQPPRSLQAQAGSLYTILTWNTPVITRGIVGYRIYRDNETNLVEEIRDPKRRQFKLSLPANTTVAVFISSFTAQGAESVKVPIQASSNTDQLVVSGTGGGTGGSSPAPPPEWPSEPTGGKDPGKPLLIF